MRYWRTGDGLPQNSVLAVEQTPDGYLWLGTFNGLVRFDGVRFETYTSATVPVMTSDSVACLYAEANGTLWVGTEGGGLLKFDDGKVAAAIDERDSRVHISHSHLKGFCETNGSQVNPKDHPHHRRILANFL